MSLAARLIFFAVRAQRQDQWSRLARAVYSLIVVAAVAFTGFLVYWNALAFPL